MISIIFNFKYIYLDMKHKAIIRFLCPSLSHFWSLIPDPSPLSHLQITYNWNLKVFNSATKFFSSSVFGTFFLNILIVMRDIYFPSSINCSVPLSLMTITVGLTLRPSWQSGTVIFVLFIFLRFSQTQPAGCQSDVQFSGISCAFCFANSVHTSSSSLVLSKLQINANSILRTLL